MIWLYHVYYIQWTNEVIEVSIEQSRIWWYLKRVNFDNCINCILWLDSGKSIHTWNNNNLIELSIFSTRDEFWEQAKKLTQMLIVAWVDRNWANTITSVLIGEIIENAFEHSWSVNRMNETAVGLFAHLNSYTNKLEVIIFDFWIGLSWSLSKKFKEIWSSEVDYIKKAIQQWVSWRTEWNNWIQSDWSTRWWMWLYTLQEYIIGRYWWDIKIISKWYYWEIKSIWEFDFLHKLSTINNGVIVHFTMPLKND